MVVLADPVTKHLVDAVDTAISQVLDNLQELTSSQLPNVNPAKMHEAVCEMYSWHNVASRTAKVYSRLLRSHILGCCCDKSRANQKVDVGSAPILERYKLLYGCGPISGKLFCILVTLDMLLHYFLCWLFPEEAIDVAPDFDYDTYSIEDTRPLRPCNIPLSSPKESPRINELGSSLLEFKLDSDEDFDDFSVT